MNQNRHQRKMNFAGPKALAVLSCALALLTAQPWTAKASTPSQTAAVRSVGSLKKVDGQSAGNEAAAKRSTQNFVAIAHGASVGESHARIHATWAAIHNWIVATLFVSHADAGVKHLDVHAPQPTKFEDLPILEQIDIPDEELLEQPPQILWTLENLLLAPPVC